MKKKRFVRDDEELSAEDIAATFELQKRPKVVLDRVTLEHQTATLAFGMASGGARSTAEQR